MRANAKMFQKAVIGGTYNVIHKGHVSILETGFQISRMVIIGLTSDEFAGRFRAGMVLPFEERRKKLEEFVKEFGKEYEIVKIEDSYGVSTLDPELDCIIVSEETLLRANEINAIRFKKGLDKLTIVVVPIVLAEDGKPVSGDRIKKGIIDRDGKILR